TVYKGYFLGLVLEGDGNIFTLPWDPSLIRTTRSVEIPATESLFIVFMMAKSLLSGLSRFLRRSLRPTSGLPKNWAHCRRGKRFPFRQVWLGWGANDCWSPIT